jgi:hypothetical protein
MEQMMERLLAKMEDKMDSTLKEMKANQEMMEAR